MNVPSDTSSPTLVSSPPVLPIFLPTSEARAREAYIRHGPEAALEIYVELAKSGSSVAQAVVALMYLNRMIEGDDYLDRAIHWAEQSAAQGDSYGMWVLSWAQFENDNWQDGMKSLLDAAEDDFPPALYTLGSFVGNGVIIPRDLEKSVRLFRRAADQGHTAAQSMLEAINMTGIFGPVRRLRQTIMRPFSVLQRIIYVLLFRPRHSARELIYPRFLHVENSLRRQFGEDIGTDLEEQLDRTLARLR